MGRYQGMLYLLKCHKSGSFAVMQDVLMLQHFISRYFNSVLFVENLFCGFFNIIELVEDVSV